MAERGLADAELTARLARYLDRAAEEGFTVEPGGLMVALRAANEPGPIKISLQVESGPPHRISGISVQLGN